MNFKVDENLPAEVASVLCRAGHDALSVRDQGLGGARDLDLSQVCRAEQRILLTLDGDFADIRSHPPAGYPGFIVLRLRRQDTPHVLEVMARLVKLLAEQSPDRRLWIVEEDRVRIRGQ